MDDSANSIQKDVLLRAPLARVWKSVTDSNEFGAWFGVKFDAPFVVGKTSVGQLQFAGKEHVKLTFDITAITPQTYFAYRWHPYAIDDKVDYSSEPTTLVEFRLREVPEGVALQITESGFENIPHARRAEAFRMNEGGWTAQAKKIDAYVTK